MSHMPRRAAPLNTGDAVLDSANPLTPKQRAFTDAVISGQRIQEAALSAGYSPAVAKSDAYQLLSQPHIQAYARACLDAAGLTMNRQAEILADAAENAQTMIVDKSGEEHFNRDHRTSIEAVRIAMNASGTIGPRTTEGGAGVTVNITIDNRALPPQDVIDITPDDTIRG